MKRTTAPGAVAGSYVDDNPSGGIVGTLIIATDKNTTQEEICAVVEGAGITLSSGDDAQLWKAIRKKIKETSKEIGELYFLQEEKAPVAYSAGAVDSYFPGLCLTNIDSYVDIDEANYPDLVPWLRARQLIYLEGLTGEQSDLDVTDWDITSNVATLTIDNTADNINWLNALLEDKNFHGSYTNWKTVTLPADIGDIVAGTYSITEIDSVSRYIKFAYTASNNSGSGTWTVEFYPYRIAGSSSTAREFSLKGLTIHGQGDDNGLFFNMLRRRGHLQGHRHKLAYDVASSPAGSINSQYIVTSNTGAAQGENTNTNVYAGTLYDDGTNGTPREGLDTHGPEISSHVYRHAGRYL